MRTALSILAIALTLLAACEGEESAEHAAPAAASAVALTGTIIDVTMQSDDKGNYFEPATFSAKAGDVIRFKLVQGVHNVNFVADSNPGHTGLPAASVFAQLPGQTIDVPLTFGTGKFFFQCDPHAMLGMMGHVTITP